MEFEFLLNEVLQKISLEKKEMSCPTFSSKVMRLIRSWILSSTGKEEFLYFGCCAKLEVKRRIKNKINNFLIV